jgi:hypothetical protein
MAFASLARWYGIEHITLLSPLGRDECVCLLQQAVQSDRAWFGKRKAAVGRVNATSLRIRKTVGWRDSTSWQPWLSGSIKEVRAGTRFDCRLGVTWGTVASLPAILLLVWLMCAGLVKEDIDSIGRGEAPVGILVPLIFTACGIGAQIQDRAKARGHRQFLLDFMNETVRAREKGWGQEAVEKIWQRGD